ncbi:MAG: response regulator [Bdellovibrionales bacterium]|nr:response regulator [Oligoflexia bacterium]
MAKSLFIVEDDEFIRSDLIELLLDEGYDVTAYKNGQEAWDALNARRKLPDLIILDLMMPMMDGYEFTEQLSKVPRLTPIPILVLSADARAKTKLSFPKIARYMKKPMDLDRFLVVVDELVTLPKRPEMDLSQPSLF